MRESCKACGYHLVFDDGLCAQHYAEKARDQLSRTKRERDTARADYERLATSNEFACSTVYHQLITELEVPPGGSLIDAVDKLRHAPDSEPSDDEDPT